MPLTVAHVGTLALATGYFLARRAQLAQDVPVQWGLDGHVTRRGNPNELWILGGMIVFNLLLVGVVALRLSREARSIPRAQRERYLTLQLQRRTLNMRAAEVILLGMSASTAVGWVAIVELNIARDTSGFHLGLLVPLGIFAATMAWSAFAYILPVRRIQQQLDEL